MIVELISLLAAVGCALAVVVGIRGFNQRAEATTRRSFRLRFPRDLTPEAVAAFLQGTSGLLPPGSHGILGLPSIVLEVRADHHGISHWLAVPQSYADFVLGQLRSAIPSIRVVEERPETWTFRACLELRLSRGRVPLRTAASEAVASSMLACLHPLGEGERVTVQWVIAPSLVRSQAETKPAAEDLHDVLAGRQSVPKLTRERRAKLGWPLFNCVGRIGVDAASTGAARALTRRALLGVYAARSLEARLVPRLLPKAVVRRRIQKAAVPAVAFPSLLNSNELAALAAFPMGSVVLPGLDLGGAREMPPPNDVPTAGLVLGQATYPGAERAVAISEADAARHLLIAGPTGAGKSVVLNHLAVNRMQAGDGVLVIDPAGDLAARIMDSIPPGREADVIVIDPADVEWPVAINLLGTPGRSKDLIVDDFVAVVKRAWGDFLVGARSEDILRMTCSTIVTQPDAVLTDLPRLLVDKNFRRKIVAGLDDPIALGPFWAWFESLTIAKRADVIGPISNKLRSFYRPLLRNIIGQVESSFSMAEAMQEGKIIICSLARGAMGESAASFFGAMLMALWAQAVQSRVNLPPEQRRPFYAFVDEYQTLLGFSSPIDEILAQARKFNASLCIATQSLSTLPVELKQASLVNTRSKVVFQTSAADAPLFAKEFAPHLNADDLRWLEGFHAYAAVSVGAMTSPPISIRTLPPPPTTGSAARVRGLSRQRYGRPRAEVEQALRERYEAKAPSEPVGRKPKAGGKT